LQYIIPTPPKLQDKSPTLKREHLGLQHTTFFNFYFQLVIFAHLDLDPDPTDGSGSTTLGDAYLGKTWIVLFLLAHSGGHQSPLKWNIGTLRANISIKKTHLKVSSKIQIQASQQLSTGSFFTFYSH
jgi:hypothetical protein